MIILKSIWDGLSNLGVDDQLLSGEVKRTRLSNRIGFCASLIGIPHAIHYYELGLVNAVWAQIFTNLGLAMVLFWNHRGCRKLARYWLIILADISVFLTSSFLGFESGEHLTFFGITLVIFTFFDIKDKKSIFFLVTLSFVFVVGLEMTNYEAFGESVISMEERRSTYFGNFVIHLVVALMITLYFQSLSDKQVDGIIFKAQKELKAVFDNSFDAIFVAELSDHRIIEGNYRSLEIFEYDSLKEIVGKKVPDLMKNSHGQCGVEEVNQSLLNNEKWSAEHEFKRTDGDSFWGNIAYTFIRFGEEQKLLVRVTDISETKEFEQKLILAKERAESATIAKAHFLNNMSHEIRTPINGVIGLAEIISTEYGEQNEDLSMYANLLLESGQRLLRTIGSILDLSNLETYEAELSTSKVCLNQVLESTAREFENQANEQGISLVVRKMDRIFYSETELSLLQKVLEHLIGNSVKFTKKGGVEAWIEPYVKGASEKLCWDIIIKDTGIGMSQDFVRYKLFKKFEQESEGLDRNYEGAGLGLSLVKRILELLKGEIIVSSERGKGSTFIVRLPGSSVKRI